MGDRTPIPPLAFGGGGSTPIAYQQSLISINSRTTMTLKELKELLGNKSMSLKKSENFYAGTEENILYVSLPRNFEGQTFLVFSRTAAAEVVIDPQFAYKCEVTQNDGFWGLTMPSKSEIIATL